MVEGTTNDKNGKLETNIGKVLLRWKENSDELLNVTKDKEVDLSTLGIECIISKRKMNGNLPLRKK